MSFWEFLSPLFNLQVAAFIGTIILGAACLVGGAFAGVIGAFHLADSYGWGWNLLYVPAVTAVALLAFAFFFWLGVEVVAK